MLLALACHLCIAIMGQVLLANIYDLTAVGHGARMGLNFFKDGQHAIHAFGVISVLSVTGIWLIKFNFLLFLYRLDSLLTKYRIWW